MLHSVELAGDQLPSSQGFCNPAEQLYPAEHSRHDPAPSSEYVPSLQSEHITDLEGAKVPAAHLVDFVDEQEYPAGQSLQNEDPDAKAVVPSKHAIFVPAIQAKPDGHFSQPLLPAAVVMYPG